MQRQIILDTETTGLSHEAGDRIIELGCIELLGRRRSGHNLHLYFNPGRSSHPDAVRIHGISDEFLGTQPTFADKAGEICQYLQGAQLIIHNAPFDLGFLDKEMQLAGRTPILECASGVLDTLALARDMFPGKRNSLDALCDRLDIDRSGRSLHGALLDADLLAQVYLLLTRGQEALLAPFGEAADQGLDGQAAGVDLRTLALPVLRASAQEIEAHEAMLEQLDKTAGGCCAWRSFEPQPE